MLNCILYASLLIGSFFIHGPLATLPVVTYATMLFIICIVLLIWGITLLNHIVDSVRSHIKSFYELDVIRSRKETYQRQLTDYKAEMQSELLDKYREFEKMIMTSIKDSQLLAAVLKDSGYDSILSTYNSAIKDFLGNIHGCDRSEQIIIAKLQVNTSDIFGNALFIPEKYKYNQDQGRNK